MCHRYDALDKLISETLVAAAKLWRVISSTSFQKQLFAGCLGRRFTLASVSDFSISYRAIRILI
jgi:hypothetical protein